MRLAFQIYKDTVDNPIMGTDREHLMTAVQEGNITALKEMKAKNKFTLVDIVKAAIEKDQETVVEEFSEEMQRSESVTMDALLDYSIRKKAMNTSRKISGTLGELGRRVMPLLTMAIEKKDTAYVNQILDEHPEELVEMEESPLHMAARSASALMARSLTERNSSWVNMRASYGRTPLHIAAEEGSADVCEALLECGADVNAKDDRGRTPLFCCVEKRVDGDVECMEVLFKHKARIEEKSCDQITALHVAARGFCQIILIWKYWRLYDRALLHQSHSTKSTFLFVLILIFQKIVEV